MALGAGGLLCKPALARNPLPETAARGRIQTGAGTPINLGMASLNFRIDTQLKDITMRKFAIFAALLSLTAFNVGCMKTDADKKADVAKTKIQQDANVKKTVADENARIENAEDKAKENVGKAVDKADEKKAAADEKASQ